MSWMWNEHVSFNVTCAVHMEKKNQIWAKQHLIQVTLSCSERGLGNRMFEWCKNTVSVFWNELHQNMFSCESISEWSVLWWLIISHREITVFAAIDYIPSSTLNKDRRGTLAETSCFMWVPSQPLIHIILLLRRPECWKKIPETVVPLYVWPFN